MKSNRDKPFLIIKILAWGILIFAPLIYLVIAYFLDIEGVETTAGNDVLLYILLILAITQPPIIAFVIDRFHSRIPSTARNSSKSHEVGKYTTMSIAKFAAVEAVFIYGFVVNFVTGNLTYMLWFYPIGALWAAVYWPRREKFDRFTRGY